MAKAQSKSSKAAEPIAISEPPDDVLAADEPEATQDPPEPREPEATSGIPRKVADKSLTFFQRMARIPVADWGARAYVMLYRLEPIIDALRSTEVKYIAKYAEVIDQERIKQDHGSGRYRLYLTYKEAGKKEGKELDSTEFDINDPNFPPLLALGQWVEDPKNKKWAWAKAILEKKEADKKQQQNAPQQLGLSPGDVLDLVDRVAERLKPAAPVEQKSAASDLTALVTAAKGIADLKQPSQVAAPQNSEELKELREEMKFYRTELIKALTNKPEGKGFETFSAVLKEIKEFLPQVKTLIPEGLTEGAASRMSGSQEFWQGIATTAIDKLSPIFQMFAQFMVARAMQAKPATPGQPTSTPAPVSIVPAVQRPAPPQPAAAPTGEPQPLNPVVETPTPPEDVAAMMQVIGRTVAQALADGKHGYEYAEAFENMFGAAVYDQLAALPQDRLLQLFQALPMWNQLGILQSKVPQFIADFVDWGKEDTEGNANPTGDEAEPGPDK